MQISNMSSMKLGEWWDFWVQTYRCHAETQTLRSYETCRKRLEKLSPTLMTTALPELTEIQIQDVINQMTLSPRTIELTWSALNAILKKAVKLNLIPVNVAQDIEKPKSRKTRGGKLIADSNLRNIIRHCQNVTSEPSQVYRDMLLFLIYHGCRPQEARALRVQQINRNWIHIQAALDRQNKLKAVKTHRAIRRLPIAPHCATMIQRRLEISKSGWLFENSNNNPVRDEALRNYLYKITDHQYSPYDIRHTFCTKAVQNNQNLKVISTITGHSVKVLLSEYVHVQDTELQQIIGQMDLTLAEA